MTYCLVPKLPCDHSHATLALCHYCHATLALCQYCHATQALCQYCHATLALCQCCHERDLQGHRSIACLVPRPHPLLDINYCVGLATKLCLSPCDCIALGQSCHEAMLPCADVALCQSCHVPMLPCDLLSCADVAL